MKTIRGWMVALIAISLSGGCENSITAPSPENARLRVVHGSPDAPNVDVLVDGNVALTNVPYKTASSYLQITAGTHNVKVRAAGTSTTVIDASLDFAADSDVTIIASGLLANLTPLVLTDVNTAPTTGNVKVRLVHGAPSAPVVDIYVTAPGADLSTSTPTLADVPFAAISPYLEVPAGTYQVRITPANDPATVAIDTGALTLAAGQIRTGIAVDATGGGAPFGAVLLADRD